MKIAHAGQVPMALRRMLNMTKTVHGKATGMSTSHIPGLSRVVSLLFRP